MLGINENQQVIDPIESLNECLGRTWASMGILFDASASLPELSALFDKVELNDPCVAAEKIIVNMLMEMMECISRFSAWYRQPARAFGLTTFHDPLNNRNGWLLAPEALLHYERNISELEYLIQNYRGIIKAVLLVDGLMTRGTPEDPVVTASCDCVPRHAIQVRRSVLGQTEVVCEQCHQPYRG